MADTFDSDPNTLPPLTKAIRQCWPMATATGAQIQPGEISLRAFLDAVHGIENRLIAGGL
ncbi:MAG: hypothetical protein JWR32_3657 [Mycobacterium sp.]|jgi:hypothetical protein|nr:hypothetical protein [Mycobacterium sp.]